jgi:hypothetical protein
MKLKPLTIFKGRYVDHYIIPRANSGYTLSGYQSEFEHGVIPRTNCNYITIATEHGTNEVVTAFPSSANPFDVAKGGVK